MKIFSLLLFSALIASCGEIPVEPEGIEDRIGQNLTADPNDKLSSEEVSNLTKICNAIADKEFIYEDRVRTSTPVEINSKVFVKGCEDEEFAQENSTTATLGDSNGDLVFTPKDSSNNFYKNVLVKDSKQLEGLCDDDADVSTDTQRYSLSGSYGTWVQVLNNRSGACGERMEGESEPNSGSTLCYIVTTAQKNDNNPRYIIRNVELFEVDISTGTSRGLVSKRSYATSIGCAADEVSKKTIQLNSF